MKTQPGSQNAAAPGASSAKVLEVHGVSKSYGALKALDAVSLSITEGEFVALLGPNGAGKTTLFQLLSGLFVADAGRILVDGLDIGRDPVAVLARLGVVFQQATLDLDLSVYANLRFHARLHGIGGRGVTDRIRAELDRIGLTEQTDGACRKLSGGNRRKVELARALLHAPRLLLMDEATVGLDPRSRRALLDYVHDLCRERGMAVLWATHLVDEAEEADRVLVLHRGHLMTEGTPAQLLADTGEASLADAFLNITGVGR